MALYAIGDTHLSLSVNKPMTVFPGWDDYVQRLETNWRTLVAPEDTVVIPGDVSWGMSLEQAKADFAFLQSLPGRKLLPLYPLAKPLFRLLRTGTVRDLQRMLRRLGLGRYVDTQAAAELADRPILPYLEWILLQFMDGSGHPVSRDSAVYRLVLSVIEIPAHLLPGNMDMKKLIFACDAILTGGAGDHQQSIL